MFGGDVAAANHTHASHMHAQMYAKQSRLIQLCPLHGGLAGKHMNEILSSFVEAVSSFKSLLKCAAIDITKKNLPIFKL